MKTIRIANGPTISAYNVPDVGDKVADEDGSEGYCTGIYKSTELLYEIAESWEDPNSAKALVPDKVFKNKTLTVLK